MESSPPTIARLIGVLPTIFIAHTAVKNPIPAPARPHSPSSAAPPGLGIHQRGLPKFHSDRCHQSHRTHISPVQKGRCPGRTPQLSHHRVQDGYEDKRRQKDPQSRGGQHRPRAGRASQPAPATGEPPHVALVCRCRRERCRLRLTSIVSTLLRLKVSTFIRRGRWCRLLRPSLMPPHAPAIRFWMRRSPLPAVICL